MRLVSLVRRSFVQQMTLKGTDCVQYFQPAGHVMEKWATTNYNIILVDNERNKHTVLALVVDMITSNV